MEHIESVDVNEDQALYTIEEKPVLVIDGIFDEDTLRGWVDFYQYKPFYNNGVISVSYTHLTLPTILLV